jgi:cytochrome P450
MKGIVLHVLAFFFRADLDRLEFLTQCIKEGMRLHSPVPGIMRVNLSPVEIENHVIPAESIIAISIYSLHHNPAVWGEDHMAFKPERFTKANVEKRNPFAFCPFSAGPRYVNENSRFSQLITHNDKN